MSLEEETQWLLDALGQAGMPFGIVTNGSYRQKRKIEVLGLDRLTSCLFISEVFGCKKPEAEIFLAAASCLGSVAEEVLFVGDNPYADIWGAQRVGMRTAWLHRGRAWPSDLSSTTLLVSRGVQGQSPCRSARCPRTILFSFNLCRRRRHKLKTNEVVLVCGAKWGLWRGLRPH